VTFGKRGTYANVGLPGTGMSYRERLDLPGEAARAPRRGGSPALTLVLLAVVVAVLAAIVL
jgi:hypothetical protein